MERTAMHFVIKEELKWMLKNPIYYIGAVLLFMLIFSQCNVYLNIRYFDADSEIKSVPVEYFGDADIMDGYIPMTEEEKFENGIKNLKNDLIQVIGIDEQQVNSLFADIKGLEKEDAIELINERCPYLGNVEDYFYIFEAKRQANAEEANAYIKKSLNKEDYADFFGRKYSDFLGVGLFFYCLILFIIIYSYDYKKDIYELLHTKPIREWEYILAKALGGILSVVLAVSIITLGAQAILMMNKNFAVCTYKIWKYVLICNIPIVFYISFFCLFIAGLFRTSLPAIPVLFIQFIYSNNGVENADGVFHYVPRAASVFIRFPELFFETEFSSVIYINQVILCILTVIIAYMAVLQWKRKQV